jgi:formate/nitrite transporter FocA (FNT family)
VVGLGDLSHVIAGAVETLYIVMIGQKPWTVWCTGFFFPALLGNIIGGVTLVAVLNYAQVKAGGGEEM